MATLTLPMGAPVLGPGGPRVTGPAGPGGGRAGSGGAGGRAGRVRGWLRGRAGRAIPAGGVAALAVDQLGQPADLAVHRLQAVLLELERVAVEALAGAGQRRAQPFTLLLDGAPAALQDPQPGVGRGVPEEGQPDAEQPAVVVGLRAGLAGQLVEAFLALGGDRVDHLPAAAGERWRVRRQRRPGARLAGGDPAGRLQPLEGGVERAERDAAQAAEHLRQLLAQLVAVHR